MSASLAATPAQLLERARDLAARPDATAAGLWPRAAALLARQALEGALDDFWHDRGVPVGSASMRAQLLVLPSFAGAACASEASWAWWSLTRACHHHPYELPPTFGELAGLFDAVERLLERLWPAAADPTG